MAKFDMSADASDDLVAQIAALGNTETIAPRILEVAAPPLEEALKKHCQKHRRTGSMQESIKRTKAEQSKSGGYYIAVRPTGKTQWHMDDKGVRRKRNKPVRNMEVLAYIEYGTSSIAKEPIIEDAVREVRSECERLMQNEYEKIVKEGGG